MPAKKIVETQTNHVHDCDCKRSCRPNGGCGGGVYGLGIVGAAFYFFPQAIGVGGYAMAIFKSLIWPAILVYQALTLLKL